MQIKFPNFIPNMEVYLLKVQFLIWQYICSITYLAISI